jgi:hypothetical protein
LDTDAPGDATELLVVSTSLGDAENSGAPTNCRWWLSVTNKKRGRKEVMAVRVREKEGER